MKGKTLEANERLVVVTEDGERLAVAREDGADLFEAFDAWTQTGERSDWERAAWNHVETMAQEYLESIDREDAEVSTVDRETVPTEPTPETAATSEAVPTTTEQVQTPRGGDNANPRVSGLIQPSSGRPSGFIIDVPVTLSIAVRGEGLTVAKAKEIARTFADVIAPTEAFVGGYSGVIEKTQNATITEVSLESSREESCEVIDELEAEDADGEPIRTIPLAAVCPKRFAVVNLATDDQPTGFDSLDEARGAVAFDRLTAWEIWDGDDLIEHS